MANRILDPGVDVQRTAYNRLITILSATSAFAPYAAAGQRYNLCQQAGVLGPLGSLDWTAPAAQVAGSIIDRLNNYGLGSLRGRPGFTALGALIDHLLTLEEVPPDDHTWLAGLVVQYGLVTDQGYLDELVQQHGVAAQPAGAAGGSAAGHAPATLPAQPAQAAALTSAARLELAKALLQCPAVRHVQNRDAIINDLPADIQAGISRGETPLTDVRNILEACLNYEGGLGLLIESVRAYESDSLSMRAVYRLLAQLGPVSDRAPGIG